MALSLLAWLYVLLGWLLATAGATAIFGPWCLVGAGLCLLAIGLFAIDIDRSR